MHPDPRNPKALKQLLSQDRPGFARLFGKAQHLAWINQTLRQWCDEPWIAQIRLANIRGETLVLYSSSAAALIPLRHRKSALLAWLSDQHQLRCTRIETKVLPPPATAKPGVYRRIPGKGKPSG